MKQYRGNGGFLIRKSKIFWNLLISIGANEPGLYHLYFLISTFQPHHPDQHTFSFVSMVLNLYVP